MLYIVGTLFLSGVMFDIACILHTYIYQEPPFKFILLEYSTAVHLYLLEGNTII